MSKYKLKAGAPEKGLVSYRTPKKGGMRSIDLEHATQEQLAELASIGHPFVIIDKKAPAAKKEAKP